MPISESAGHLQCKNINIETSYILCCRLLTFSLLPFLPGESGCLHCHLLVLTPLSPHRRHALPPLAATGSRQHLQLVRPSALRGGGRSGATITIVLRRGGGGGGGATSAPRRGGMACDITAGLWLHVRRGGCRSNGRRLIGWAGGGGWSWACAVGSGGGGITCRGNRTCC